MINEVELPPPEDHVLDDGSPFNVATLIKILKKYPYYKVRVSSFTTKCDYLRGSSEGNVDRITIVPALEEVVLYNDFEK
jgi:hypothetical protein